VRQPEATAHSQHDSTLDVPADLNSLSREQLIALLEARNETGIHIEFAGKANARTLARRVRPRVTRTLKKYSAGSPEMQALNLVVEGDNLQSLATLYRERGQVDLILADPPYNTGKDFRYNDRWEEDPNDPELGAFVPEDDRARHTKWMRFMWPRLQMMKAMLKSNGVIAVCIDYRELFRLGQMLDELFGERNRLAIINWQKATALKNANDHVSNSTEYVLVYAKDESRAQTGSLERTESQNSRYSNPDNDPRGMWREGMLAARDYSTKDFYGIQSPFTGELHYPPGNSHWRHPKKDVRQWLEEWGSSYEERDVEDGEAPALVLGEGFSSSTRERALSVLAQDAWPFIWFGRKGDGIPRKKIFLSDVKAGRIPETYWAADDFSAELSPDELGSTSWGYRESGRSSDGAGELTAIVGDGHRFETVKPLKLFEKIIALWCPPNGVVLDPFAGSGTTGHAVLSLNESSQLQRRFILIEQGRPERGDSYARSLLAQRLSRVISGNWAAGAREPLPGGFHFVTLGKKVDADTLLRMERDEMVDTVIASHFESGARRSSALVRFDEPYRYLVAKNADNQGVFLVWDGPDKNIDFTEDVYYECAREAQAAGLRAGYHVYARFYLYQTDNVRFYQIPDRILADFGLDLRSEPFEELPT
jgi:adenine-specific DNA-methyltransferase